MAEENISQEFRLKKSRGNKKLFHQRNKPKWLGIKQKAQKSLDGFELHWTLAYLSFNITGCFSIFAFASLVGAPIEIKSSVIELKS